MTADKNRVQFAMARARMGVRDIAKPLNTRLTGRAPFTAWAMQAIAKVPDTAPQEYRLYFLIPRQRIREASFD